MPNWHVGIDGPFVRLLHNQADDEGGVWSGVVKIHRGAPAADSHPELQHAFLAIMNPAVHREFIRHSWTFHVPDTWGGRPNYGEHRRFLELQAKDGWTLLLELPHGAPRYVWQALIRAFNAKPKETRTMKPTNSAVAVPAALPKGEIPKADAPPPAAKAGIKSITSGGY